ncbi:sentrin-specific protease 7 isoform X3 [Ascaphus truei]|uniref:sentrin-specific protease 7 isoform X3 n=1 Tax=Ascaphus truei TaxID=8439 RepID=UPI003F5A0765
MMEKQRKDSSSSIQESGRAPVFRIPKKKADGWSEDIQLNSPLSKLPDTEFRNITTRKRFCASSYDSFNKTRNKDSNIYYMSKSGYNKCRFTEERSPSRQPKVLLTDVLRTDLARQYATKNITDTNSCNMAKLQISHISTTSINPETCQTLDDPQESLYFSARYAHNKGVYNEMEPSKEKELSSAVSPIKRHIEERKDDQEWTPPNKACRDVSNTPTSSQKDMNLWSSRSDHAQRSEGSQEEKAPEREEPVKGNVVSSSKSTRENTYCVIRVEQLRNKAIVSPINVLPRTDTSGVNTSSMEQSLEPSTCGSDNKTNSTDSECTTLIERTLSDKTLNRTFNIPHPKVHGNKMSRRKLHTNSLNSEMLSSDELIVLSSDEERECGENPETVRSWVAEEPLSENKEAHESVMHQLPCTEKEKAEPTRNSDSEKEMVVNSEMKSPMLEFTCKNVYIGRKKGRATGSAKFTTKSIDIPLKVALLKRICLSVDTMKLQKYGLWITDGGDSVRSNAILFLWIAADYVQQILNQLGTHNTNQTSRSNEFIFLELCDTPTKEEQDQLSEIMKEVSKNSSPVLGDDMSWEKAYPMLKNVPHTESSFMANCFSEFEKLQQQPKSTQALPEILPQVSKMKRTAPTYTLLQRHNSEGFSVSLVPMPDNGWKEMQSSGCPLKLIVYPPPPTKRGLGVTHEDLECLEHGEFLNDVIIDFYLKYLLLEKFPKPFAERSHIFSSFFYKCLTRKDTDTSNSNLSISTAQRRHQRVKTWTRHVDIFTKDFIFVPVNENSHWYLAVICFPWLENAVYEDRKLQSSTLHQPKATRETAGSVIIFNKMLSKKEETMDEESSSQSEVIDIQAPRSGNIGNENPMEPVKSHCGKVCKRPCLLIFDSLKAASVQTTVKVLREYLKVEWDVKRKTAREFSRSDMREFYPRVPKQNNSSDCGIYLLQYVESFFQQPIESFEHPMHLENWFPLHVVKNKREEIRGLILQLHLQQKSCNR